MNLTCIDIGNTEIDIATYISDNDFIVGNLDTHDDTIFEFIKLKSTSSLINQFDNIAISSVVPKIEEKIIKKFQKLNLSCFSVSYLDLKLLMIKEIKSLKNILQQQEDFY